ncbi:hypothetical protein SLNWT_5900 [Streptomyces albus]|uniref:Uncharacterized protein n=1 Tax=Streptomyces albus (strain ATCC 21838 / DSM 41398 / FERM P-419 / JCM 4703 / NBRC 107858) TaxID=1081613 RepID=A0A0B5F5V5_STRA4|nr:hypothetical protein SLNWT_5900 [Streptomyces albus]AOU80578.1 hypothetical protein SLNHY_5887 [Streptomyces albus]AYN36289.1 hypothetical protein DUI70_5794 [Streptomyces albus]
MLALVLVGVAVPPAAVGAAALRDPRRAPGRLRLLGCSGLLDDRLPRRILR